MSRPDSRHVALVLIPCIAGLVCLGALLRAAPVLPELTRASQQQRSLEGIERVSLRIDPLPDRIRKLGIKPAILRQRWTAQLKAEGIAVGADDQGTPTLRFIISTVTARRVPGAVAFNPYLTLEQSVRIERLDVSIVVPTYAHVVCGLEADEDLRKSVLLTADMMIHRFIDAYRRAQGKR